MRRPKLEIVTIRRPPALPLFLYLLAEMEAAIERGTIQWDADLPCRPSNASTD